MKIDILAVLHEEYPDFLDSKDDFVSDNMKEFQNSEVHLKNLHELLTKEENYIENILLKEILDLVSEMGYDPSCEYFAAITKKISVYVRVGKDRVIVVDDLLRNGLIEFYVLVFAWANKIDDTYTFEYH